MTTLQDAGSRNGTRYALIVMDPYDRCHSVLEGKGSVQLTAGERETTWAMSRYM